MIYVRKAEDRGHINHGWLNTYHTFSFGDYHDPNHMGFRSLRVINEDWVQAGHGFPTHPHRDMEIITYVLEGSLGHKDSMGTGSVILPGEVQKMSAGTGIRHSEFNHSKSAPVHLLQIWIVPEKTGIQPNYEQKAIPADEKKGKLRLVASRDGREDSVTVYQDAELYAADLAASETVNYQPGPGRHSWIQVARGQVIVNGKELRAGDGAAIAQEPKVEIVGSAPQSELLLFDLA
jgi:quercetin 2,3-dioxygenase